MLTEWLMYQRLVRTLKPRRYRNLIKTIFHTRPRRLVEVGVWNGVHAVQMLSTAAAHHNRHELEYFGFDLFEDLSDDMLAKEFSKRPPPMREVKARLQSTGAQITLFKGNTKETLAPGFQEIGAPDFVFIDGGHSAESVLSDWTVVSRAMAPHTVVIFDDYYVNATDRLAGLGCQQLIDGLDPATYSVERLDPVDRFEEPGGIRDIAMVRVTMNGTRSNSPRRA